MQLTDQQIHKAFEFMFGKPAMQFDLIVAEVLDRRIENIAKYIKLNKYPSDEEITEEFIADTIKAAIHD